MGRERVLAVVLLAILAGCGGIGGDGGAPETTVTPAPVPGQETPVQPGVWSDRIESGTIVENHESSLANTSYTVEKTLTVGGPDNASIVQRTEAAVGAGGEPIRIQDGITSSRGSFPRRGTDIWWNGNRTFYRYRYASGQYNYYFSDGPPADRFLHDGQFADLLTHLSVSSVRRDGAGTVVAGYVTDSEDVPTIDDPSAIEHPTMTMRIGPDGIVDRLAVGYDAVYDRNESQRVRYTRTIDNVSTTTVERPAWLRASLADEDE